MSTRVRAARELLPLEDVELRPAKFPMVDASDGPVLGEGVCIGFGKGGVDVRVHVLRGCVDDKSIDHSSKL